MYNKVCIICLIFLFTKIWAQYSRPAKPTAFSFSIAGDLLPWGSDRLTGMEIILGEKVHNTRVFL